MCLRVISLRDPQPAVQCHMMYHLKQFLTPDSPSATSYVGGPVFKRSRWLSLVLDEPTNHLNLRAVLWLEEYMSLEEDFDASATVHHSNLPPSAVLLHPRHHLLSSPPSSLSLRHRQQHDVTKSSNHHAQPPLSRTSLIRLNTEREERGDLSGGEMCVGMEGSGEDERLGGGCGSDELRGGVRRQVSETWSSSP
ncbi:BnaC05g25210D [Brassica napus]|uniref:BnaC05g25210D protein n=2 Tax=Brassica TaxID=3705 RepID=A0A078IJJ8_BRANA|nr:BnaC05g25210D [Brassica napus]